MTQKTFESRTAKPVLLNLTETDRKRLKVDPRRVRQWLAGELRSRPGVMQDIIALLEANKTEVGTAIRLLKRKYKTPAE